MRALRLLTLAAAMIVPAAAAHAQFGVYVGPPAPYGGQVYGAGYWIPAHWAGYGYGRYWVPARWVGGPGWGRGYYGWREHEWREHHGWGRRW